MVVALPQVSGDGVRRSVSVFPGLIAHQQSNPIVMEHPAFGPHHPGAVVRSDDDARYAASAGGQQGGQRQSWFPFLKIEADVAMTFISGARTHSNAENFARSLGSARKALAQIQRGI